MIPRAHHFKGVSQGGVGWNAWLRGLIKNNELTNCLRYHTRVARHKVSAVHISHGCFYITETLRGPEAAAVAAGGAGAAVMRINETCRFRKNVFFAKI